MLLRLYDCRSCEEQLAIYEKYSSSEKELCEKLLQAEKQQTMLALKERDIALKESALYKGLYESIRKKPAGFGCWMKRIFTIGIAKCY